MIANATRLRCILLKCHIILSELKTGTGLMPRITRLILRLSYLWKAYCDVNSPILPLRAARGLGEYDQINFVILTKFFFLTTILTKNLKVIKKNEN